jgi:hypothetical protein
MKNHRDIEIPYRFSIRKHERASIIDVGVVGESLAAISLIDVDARAVITVRPL